MKKYNLILADSPWKYKDYSAPAGETHNRARGAAKHYPTMTLDQLKALEIPAADRCALFLWCTWPLMFETVPQLLKAWNFEFKTLAWEWVKMVKDGSRPIMGMGRYTRSNVEPCILAFRGKPFPVASHKIINVIFAPRGKHSRKPDQQYENIDLLYPQLTDRLELFATQKRPGWDVWGNGVESDIAINGS